MWDTHVTKWVHAIRAKWKPKIPWLIRKCFIYDINAKPQNTICWLSYIIIHRLPIRVLGQESCILRGYEQILHAWSYEEVPTNHPRNFMACLLVVITLVCSSLPAFSTWNRMHSFLQAWIFLNFIPSYKQSSWPHVVMGIWFPSGNKSMSTSSNSVKPMSIQLFHVFSSRSFSVPDNLV